MLDEKRVKLMTNLRCMKKRKEKMISRSANIIEKIMLECI